MASTFCRAWIIFWFGNNLFLFKFQAKPKSNFFFPFLKDFSSKTFFRSGSRKPRHVVEQEQCNDIIWKKMSSSKGENVSGMPHNMAWLPWNPATLANGLPIKFVSAHHLWVRNYLFWTDWISCWQCLFRPFIIARCLVNHTLSPFGALLTLVWEAQCRLNLYAFSVMICLQSTPCGH